MRFYGRHRTWSKLWPVEAERREGRDSELGGAVRQKLRCPAMPVCPPSFWSATTVNVTPSQQLRISRSLSSNFSSLGRGDSWSQRQGCQVKYRMPSEFHMHSKYFLSIGLSHKRNWLKCNWASVFLFPKSGNAAGGHQRTDKSAKGDHVSLSTCQKCQWYLPSIWSTQGIKVKSIQRQDTMGSGAPGRAAGEVAECGPMRTVGGEE